MASRLIPYPSICNYSYRPSKFRLRWINSYACWSSFDFTIDW